MKSAKRIMAAVMAMSGRYTIEKIKSKKFQKNLDSMKSIM